MSAPAAPAQPVMVRPEVRSRPARPGYRALSIAVLLLSGLLVWYFLLATRGAPVPAATELGRWYGVIGALLLAFLSLYGLRRFGYSLQAGRLEWWYRAHLALGVLCLALLGCHCASAWLGTPTAPGGRWAHGFRSPFLTLLQIGFWGTVLT